MKLPVFPGCPLALTLKEAPYHRVLAECANWYGFLMRRAKNKRQSFDLGALIPDPCDHY